MSSKIHDNIRALCEKKQISVKELERKAGVSNGIVGKWKDAEPNLGSLRKIAAVLDCTIDELIEG